MPCYKPLDAYKTKINGKNKITFTWQFGAERIRLPCGQCIGCRLERSREWAVRIMHEASLHEVNSFLTLTYDDANLPNAIYSLQKPPTDMQKFLKRLRKAYGKIRYYYCGEYGDLLLRPHYHACVFGYRPTDGVRVSARLWRSDTLSRIWGLGHTVYGDVVFDSAAYVARYITKKITGDRAGDHYGDRAPEHCQMSLKPGIGADWIKKYWQDVYNNDILYIHGNQKCRPAKYYDKLYDLQNHEKMEEIKCKRMEKAKMCPDNSRRRLRDREIIKLTKIKTFTRGYENGKTVCPTGY